MGQSALAHAAQAERRCEVASLYITRLSKAKIAKKLEVSEQTIGRDVTWLLDKWNKELIKDPVAARSGSHTPGMCTVLMGI